MELFLEPRSIAVVGASSDSRKLGYHVLTNLKKAFAGTVYPVNPKGGIIQGLRAYRSLVELPESVDLAVVVIPSDKVLGVIEEAGEVGIRAVVVESGGFAEVGRADLERELIRTAYRWGIRVVGPNCIGVFNPSLGLNTAFLPPGRMRMPRRGGLSLVSQSGAMMASIMDWAGYEDVGLAKAVSFGNKSDIDEVDVLEYLADDEDTKVVFLYLEGFKRGRGPAFIAISRKLTAKKPMVVYVGGRTQRGAEAAKSHTAAIASPYRIMRGMLRQAGAIEASSLRDAFNVIVGFDKLGVSTKPGHRVGVITDGGGIGVASVDALVSKDLEVPVFSRDLQSGIKEILPPVGSPTNPVDLTGNATDDIYARAVDLVASSGETDALLVTILVQVPSLSEDVVDGIAYNHGGLPTVAVTVGGKFADRIAKRLKASGIPTYSSAEEAAEVIKAILDYANRPVRRSPKITRSWRRNSIEPLLRSAGSVRLDIAYDILGKYGISAPRSLFASTPEGAVKAAEDVGYPVVLKVSSPQIVHKSDVGGVVLDLHSSEDVERAYVRIMKRISSAVPQAIIEGVIVQGMVEGGLEAFIGGFRDERLGVIVAAGLGGTTVELLNDVSFRSYPATLDDSLEMIHETTLSKALQGFRGICPCDPMSLARMTLDVGRIIWENEEIESVDLNPVMVYAHGAMVADARIVLRS